MSFLKLASDSVAIVMVLILVVSFVNLLNIPFGTILGIYAIWVLLNDQSAALFQPRVPQTL